MILKSLMKNPILLMGILMMAIFLLSLMDDCCRRDNLIPSSCRAVRVKLDRRIPVNWSTDCDENNLSVTINSSIQAKKDGTQRDELKKALYRDLANALKKIAIHSPEDNLERTFLVTVKYIHPQLEINALTEGQYLAKMATLNDPQMIAEHLKVSVQTQEKGELAQGSKEKSN